MTRALDTPLSTARGAATGTGGVRTIDVRALSRVEGEGALYVRIDEGVVEDVRLDIYEPPRFFEAFLRGRSYTEPPDITARICGICPVAYQMSAAHAIEAACGVHVEGPLRDLRRLLYCGEWIESHALHIYLLHAPDFLGYPSGIHLAKDHPEVVKRGLELKKLGNDIMVLLGGREIHPVNVRLGGFYRVPTRAELLALRPRIVEARDAALETVRLVAGFDFPAFEYDYTFASLRHPDEYPMNEGRMVTNRGLDIDVAEFEDHFREEHVAHSTALHASVDGATYLVGPMARYALNFDKLSPLAQEAALEAGLGPVCRNPFQSIIVRAVETLYACDEALRIVDAYQPPPQPHLEVPARAGRGHACTEAPRGTLYHRYTLDDHGIILDANIVPPTAQSQRSIEQDLRGVVESHLDVPHERLQHLCEQAIRNHDPCISCSTHFLRLEVERG
ncbi:MAG: Ni/Fe hydrogenase subunit alpha [Trueperaceae bacterium]